MTSLNTPSEQPVRSQRIPSCGYSGLKRFYENFQTHRKAFALQSKLTSSRKTIRKLLKISMLLWANCLYSIKHTVSMFMVYSLNPPNFQMVGNKEPYPSMTPYRLTVKPGCVSRRTILLPASLQPIGKKTKTLSACSLLKK